MNAQKLVIPGAIVIAGALIAGAVTFTGSGANSDGGGDGSGSQVAAIAASDLNYDASAMKSLIENVGVHGRTLGSKDAAMTVVEYSDTECPFCNRFHGTMKKLVRNFGADGTVAWTYKHFPIAQLHSKAPKEARALECIRAEGGDKAYWRGIDALYSVSPGNNKLDHDKLPAIAEAAGVEREAFNTCLSSNKHQDTVQSHVEEAKTRGGSGTPFSVIELKEPLTQAERSEVKKLDDSVTSDRDLFNVSSDGSTIKISGAYPYGLLQQLVTTITDAEAGNATSTAQN